MKYRSRRRSSSRSPGDSPTQERLLEDTEADQLRPDYLLRPEFRRAKWKIEPPAEPPSVPPVDPVPPGPMPEQPDIEDVPPPEPPIEEPDETVPELDRRRLRAWENVRFF